MLQNRDLIIFGDDWGRYPSTIQYVGKELSLSNRIIWVGSLGLRKPKFNFKDLLRILEKFKKIKSSFPESKNKNVYEVHPFIIPFHDFKIIRKINIFFLLRSIRKKISELNFSNYILLTASPIVDKVVGKLNESSAHYLCLDDWAEFEGAFKSLVYLEKELLKVVDSCFAISEILVNKLKPIKGESYFLPQGVNYEHFSRNKNIPDSLNTLKQPVIGYFGLIANYVDINLMTKSALAHSDYNFLILGKTTINIDELTKLKNVTYLGLVNYSELPDYAAKFDVGLIPFCINELTIAANPLKLVEYLSLGIPVVSTNLPEVKKFGELVYVGESDEEFIKLIETAYKTNSIQKQQERKTVASSFSWTSIAERISTKILDIESKKINSC